MKYVCGATLQLGPLFKTSSFCLSRNPTREYEILSLRTVVQQDIYRTIAIVKGLWSRESTDSDTKQTHQHVFEVRNRIENKCKAARDNMETSHLRCKGHFDKNSHIITLNMFTVMLPTNYNKLLIQLKGPYEVTEKVGLTAYRILIGNNIKIFHLNKKIMFPGRQRK